MRAEFSRKTRAKAFARADGRCEGTMPDGSRCGLKLQTGRIVYDHRIPDWMGGEPTLENCQVLGFCCDKPKTAGDQADIAKVKRIRDRCSGALTSRSSWACGRNSKFKKKINGQVVLR